MKSQEIKNWRDFEAQVYAHGQSLMRHYGVFIHRFSDSRAAGNLVAQQPADFLVLGHTGRPTLLELKFSEAHESLRQCFSAMVKPHQLASARLVSRARGEYQVLFYSKPAQQLEMWDGLYLAECKAAGQVLELNRRLLLRDGLAAALDMHTFKLRKLQ